MSRFTALNSHRTSVFAAASSVAFLAAISNCCSSDLNNDDRCEQKGQEDPNNNKLPAWRRQQWQTLRNTRFPIGSDILNTINRITYKTSGAANCEAALDASVVHESNNTNQELSTNEMDYYYMKMNPDDMFEASTLDSHAVFGPLLGANLIERFNVYKRVNTNNDTTVLQSKEQQPDRKNEIAVVDLKLGTRLNGHSSIVHGGIISLLVDTALGFAYHICLHEDKDNNIAVTANLKMNFRAPFREGSEAVIRVYLDKIEGRKIFFSAVLESKDGSVVYTDATSLFIKVGRRKVVKNK
jgi:acyl-coenzyme A thioesterase PaaI-like protein